MDQGMGVLDDPNYRRIPTIIPNDYRLVCTRDDDYNIYITPFPWITIYRQLIRVTYPYRRSPWRGCMIPSHWCAILADMLEGVSVGALRLLGFDVPPIIQQQEQQLQHDTPPPSKRVKRV